MSQGCQVCANLASSIKIINKDAWKVVEALIDDDHRHSFSNGGSKGRVRDTCARKVNEAVYLAAEQYCQVVGLADRVEICITENDAVAALVCCDFYGFGNIAVQRMRPARHQQADCRGTFVDQPLSKPG